MSRTLESYQVGWICALPMEAELAELMLDEVHDQIRLPARDENIYIFGQIDVDNKGNHHNVVIAWLPAAETGKAAAATVAKDMLRTFTNLRFGLMVGIARGIWSTETDVRLGDVVVGAPDDNGPGIVQYDHGKYVQGKEFVHRGVLDKAPKLLRSAIGLVKQIRRRRAFLAHLEDVHVKELAPRPARDSLFNSSYTHLDGSKSCAECSMAKIIQRPERPDSAPKVHYGSIASGDGVVKDAIFAEKIRRQHAVLCFEMEAAGLDNFRCLVIRGISSYAHTHRNDDWHAYAASTAAAYAKELLKSVPLTDLGRPSPIGHKYWLVPRPSNPLFTGREPILQKMKDHLVPCSDGNQSKRATYVLYGMGGAGKSEVAIKFAEENRDSYWGVFWINADTLAMAERGFANIASTCELPDGNIENVKLWLASIKLPWLLILDNCDNKDIDFSSLFPPGQYGSIVVTTRLDECLNYGISDVLDDFGFEDSISLLLKACGIDSRDRAHHRDAAISVVSAAEQLAIALVHAGAYIRKGCCTLAEYPEAYRVQRKRMMEFRPSQMTSRYGSVYATFEVSAEHLSASSDEESRLALALLRIMAFLDHKGIQEDIFYRALEYCQTMESNPNTCPDITDDDALDKITPSLCQLGQSDHCASTEDECLLDHEPVKSDVLRTNAPSLKCPLRGFDPSCLPSWPRTHTVRENDMSVAIIDDKSASSQEPLFGSEILPTGGSGILKQADDGELYHLSLQHCNQLRATGLCASESLSNIRAVLVRLAELSLVRFSGNAISMHPLVHEWAKTRLTSNQRRVVWNQTVCTLALSTRERDTLQPFTVDLKPHVEACFNNHTDIWCEPRMSLNLARSLFLLAWQLYRVGNFILSLALFCNISDRCLFRPHIKQRQQQDLFYCQAVCLMLSPVTRNRALNILERVAASRLKLIGPKSMMLRQAQQALAVCCIGQNDFQRAIELLEPMVTEFQAAVGRLERQSGIIDSGDTFPSLDNEKRFRVQDHFFCMHELSIAYDALGDTERAVSLLEEVVAYQTRGFLRGGSHQLNSMYVLAKFYISLDKHEQALPLLKEVMESREKTLHRGHPRRLKSMHELAVAYSRVGKHEKARMLLEDVVEQRSSTKTSSDSLRLDSMHELVEVYKKLGQNEHAQRLLEELVKSQSLHLLPDGLDPMDHIGTLAAMQRTFGRIPEVRIQTTVMYDLAIVHQETGRLLEAKLLLEEVIGYRSKFYSPDDHERLRSMRELAIVYTRSRDARKIGEAIRLLEQVLSYGKKMFESNPELLVWTERCLVEARGMASYRSVVFELDESIRERTDSRKRHTDMEDERGIKKHCATIPSSLNQLA